MHLAKICCKIPVDIISIILIMTEFVVPQTQKISKFLLSSSFGNAWVWALKNYFKTILKLF